MLPISSDNGSRLAAILPSCLASLSRMNDYQPQEVLASAIQTSVQAIPSNLVASLAELPQVQSTVVIVVDGLGVANHAARSSHARNLTSLRPKRIETVIPSTTGAALTTLTTGRLPGEHGLIGYKIRHPKLGLVTTLKDWANIEEPKRWQRSEPLFHLATKLVSKTVVIGRPAHADGGLTRSILSGADYFGGQTMSDRFATASQLLRNHESVFAYLYIDELDKAAHAKGWQSKEWEQRLEQFDNELGSFLDTIPGNVGVVVTADHGIVDVPEHKQYVLDADPQLCQGIVEFGGEPRMRSLYLDRSICTDENDLQELSEEIAQRFSTTLGKRAWVGTRDEAIAAGWFGDISPEVAERLGEVIIAARGQYAFVLNTESNSVRDMVGHHGSISDEERGIPLALGGAYTGSNFVSVVTKVASLRSKV